MKKDYNSLTIMNRRKAPDGIIRGLSIFCSLTDKKGDLTDKIGKMTDKKPNGPIKFHEGTIIAP